MPQKTRKQKRSADLRRKAQINSTLKYVNTQPTAPSPQVVVSQLRSVSNEHRTIATVQNSDLYTNPLVVKKDLKRISIFAFFAILAQIVVYWLLQRG